MRTTGDQVQSCMCILRLILATSHISVDHYVHEMIGWNSKDVTVSASCMASQIRYQQRRKHQGRLHEDVRFTDRWWTRVTSLNLSTVTVFTRFGCRLRTQSRSDDYLPWWTAESRSIITKDWKVRSNPTPLICESKTQSPRYGGKGISQHWQEVHNPRYTSRYVRMKL